MGNAFTAVADDLTAAFWNPAGLADLRSPEFYLSYKPAPRPTITTCRTASWPMIPSFTAIISAAS